MDICRFSGIIFCLYCFIIKFFVAENLNINQSIEAEAINSAH